MDQPVVRLQRLPHAADLPLPSYATAGAAGLDLRAAVDGELRLEPGARALVPTGFLVAIPAGFEGQVRARSGLALKQGLVVLNSPGTIDSDYRGELKVILANLGQDPVSIERGLRVAQLIVAPVARAELREVAAFEEPVGERGAGGFGSTGLR